jgi:hypothetical protein
MKLSERLPSKHPAYTAEKASPGPELGSEHTDSSSVSQLIALIEKIRYVEPKLEQTAFLRRVK